MIGCNFMNKEEALIIKGKLMKEYNEMSLFLRQNSNNEEIDKKMIKDLQDFVLSELSLIDKYIKNK